MMEFELTLGAGILLAAILVTGILLKLYTRRRLRGDRRDQWIVGL